jgi:4-hydroxybenzoate polyprenyltransferase
MSATVQSTESSSRLRTYAQLVRLPNVFTALADIALGVVAISARRDAGIPWYSFALLFLASACFYSAGMVLNDVFDVEQDRRERPFRPIPSGRITLSAAVRLGWLLLAAGLVLAPVAGRLTIGPSGEWPRLPALLAGLLAIAILAYDARLKRTWAGPIGMGMCRFLNVLLAFSLAGWSTLGLYAAAVVGIYIVGVTWFARTEARQSSRPALIGASLIILAALLLAVVAGQFSADVPGKSVYLYLLVGLGFWVGIPIWQAIEQPVPARVQKAVKRCIFGLVILDTVLAVALAGVVGLGILLFLLPALYLGRWIYST